MPLHYIFYFKSLFDKSELQTIPKGKFQMKKMIALIAALLMVGGVFVGCKKTDKPAARPTTEVKKAGLKKAATKPAAEVKKEAAKVDPKAVKKEAVKVDPKAVKKAAPKKGSK